MSSIYGPMGSRIGSDATISRCLQAVTFQDPVLSDTQNDTENEVFSNPSLDTVNGIDWSIPGDGGYKPQATKKTKARYNFTLDCFEDEASYSTVHQVAKEKRLQVSNRGTSSNQHFAYRDMKRQLNILSRPQGKAGSKVALQEAFSERAGVRKRPHSGIMSVRAPKTLRRSQYELLGPIAEITHFWPRSYTCVDAYGSKNPWGGPDDLGEVEMGGC